MYNADQEINTIIIIPARYASKRLPGKPLKLIDGVSMISRTASVAKSVSSKDSSCDYVVATDDIRILEHCQVEKINCITTSTNHISGTDRVLEACQKYENISNVNYSYIINLQGDAPFTPEKYLIKLINGLKKGADVVTPSVQLTWDQLDTLRCNKAITRFSGTTIIKDSNNNALWFSKNIIPAIRNENELRNNSSNSPVHQHIGLYGYSKLALNKFIQLTPSKYEILEGLEQLRFLENKINVQCIPVDSNNLHMPGIDTADDIKIAERLLRTQRKNK